MGAASGTSTILQSAVQVHTCISDTGQQAAHAMQSTGNPLPCLPGSAPHKH
jgi:hypothetical protein